MKYSKQIRLNYFASKLMIEYGVFKSMITKERIFTFEELKEVESKLKEAYSKYEQEISELINQLPNSEEEMKEKKNEWHSSLKALFKDIDLISEICVNRYNYVNKLLIKFNNKIKQILQNDRLVLQTNLIKDFQSKLPKEIKEKIRKNKSEDEFK